MPVGKFTIDKSSSSVRCQISQNKKFETKKEIDL